MAKKMLIDATHAEETRVVVVDGTKVEEFDFETANRRQIAGNIYLAKVTRVEPSLQAAFVDYGGNRHGFLAFAEVHPDYYQIPAADRQALLDEEQAYAEAVATEEAAREKEKNLRRRKPRAARAETDDLTTSSDGIPGMQVVDRSGEGDQSDHLSEAVYTSRDLPSVTDGPAHDTAVSNSVQADAEDEDAVNQDDSIETFAEEDVVEEISVPKRPRPRRYRIQEVIKVRQIMLVQVVKEERGNKGAALTTYLSLAGRYCVLMPNTARGGGISRKITNVADRKKLKDIAAELKVPQGAGLIIRTAGSQRTRTEIKRDYEYLMRLWEQIRELTFQSVAPAPIYEEGDLIKRTIRDLYSREIDEVLVEGERGYRVAREFMKMIMPSHVRNVKHYSDPMPLYARYQVEGYLAGMFNPVVQLKSGGYIVIGVTEALVAIDVNSGRATKEGSIEETAIKTNLEAADEISRQLRLRDLAGLIVIDFIDMDERKNNLAVEKRLKDRLKTDRARIQVGRISGFGLLEMSRQRLRPGMLESTTQPCAHCFGTGLIRSGDSLALTILRAVEEEGTRRRSREVLVRAPVAVVNFMINGKREHIATIEARYGMSVRVEADPALISPDYAIDKFKTATRFVPETAAPVVSVNAQLMAQIDDSGQSDANDGEADVSDHVEAESGNKDAEVRPKRRRRRRRRNDQENTDGIADAAGINSDTDKAVQTADVTESVDPPAQTSDTEISSSELESVEPEDKAEKTKSRSRPRTRSRRKADSQLKNDGADSPEPVAVEIIDLRRKPDEIVNSKPAEINVPEASAEVAGTIAFAVSSSAEKEHAEQSAVATADAAIPRDAEKKQQSDIPAKDNGTDLVSDAASYQVDKKPPRPKRRGWWSIS